MVGGEQKFNLLNGSRGMIFPVRWHEPFGLAIIESLYFGCPVFSTPYGSLPELVPETCGFLSASASEMAEAVRANRFDPRACHAHVKQHFSVETMTRNYLTMYQRVLDGKTLNAQPPVIQDPARNLPSNA